MIRLPIYLMLPALSTVLLGQTANHSCCEMKASPRAESPGQLSVVITNLARPVIYVSRTSPDRDYGMRVISDTGQEARRTEYGRRILIDYEGRYTYTELNQGETLNETLDLSLIFELYPGVYTVTLTRDVTVEGKKVQLEATTQMRIP